MASDNKLLFLHFRYHISRESKRFLAAVNLIMPSASTMLHFLLHKYSVATLNGSRAATMSRNSWISSADSFNFFSPSLSRTLFIRSADCPWLRSLETCFFCHLKTGRGGQMKTVGSCSIDVLDSKNDFGVSAPPGEK